jgi:hypothetical protein
MSMLHSKTALSGNNNISLVLSYAPLGLVSAHHAEIGHNSILVDTGCVMLSNNSEVEIVLSIRNGERHMVHRIRARVAASVGHGFKLEFQECDVATLEALMPYITVH